MTSEKNVEYALTKLYSNGSFRIERRRKDSHALLTTYTGYDRGPGRGYECYPEKGVRHAEMTGKITLFSQEVIYDVKT